MQDQYGNQNKMINKVKQILSVLTIGAALLLLFVAWVYPEVHTAMYSVAGLLTALLAILAWINQKSLKDAIKTRSVRYGTNTAITIGLVLAILVVINFLNSSHYYRKDLTKDKIHSLSDQTVKVLKDLKQDIVVTVFVKAQARDQVKNILDNYAYFANNKFKVEYVDPDRDPARAKAANVKKYGTIILSTGTKEQRVEDVNEEKLTNGLIHLLKNKTTQICSITGHGEKSFISSEADGYSSAKEELASQGYELKEVSLIQEDKIPDTCTALVILGPNKAFFEKEILSIKTYLENGGRALVALDTNLKNGSDFHSEMTKLLAEWYIVSNQDFIVDTSSRAAGITIAGAYNKESSITQDFQAMTLFPLASSMGIKENSPASLKTWWLAKSTERAFVKTDLKEIATGKVKLDTSKDKAGPHTLMVAVQGSLKKTEDKKETRIIALGTSLLAANGYARYGANIDLFLNAISWLANDESLISIRPKEESSQIPTLTQTEGRYIQLITMILIPGAVLLLGLFVWLRRRRL